MKITTESGAVYTTEDGFWKKNDGYWNKIWRLHCISNEDIEAAKGWSDIFEAEPQPLQVGMRLYASSRDEYWLSTPIASIEEENE